MTPPRLVACMAILLVMRGGLDASDERRADALTGAVATYAVRRGDTLQALAARAGIDVATLAAENALNHGRGLAPGQHLTIDNRHIVATGSSEAAIVVNLPQRMLFVFERTVVGLPVAVGRRTWPTPLGEFQVATRETNPTWDVPASIRAEARRLGRTLPASVPPGPANPLGGFWIGLTAGAVGIHGTNVPSSIYGAVTHGCVRLHPDDIAWLFPRVNVGMTVRTVYEPVLLADIGGRVFLEVHPDVYRREPISLASVRALAADRGLTARIEWTAAARVAARRDGVARDVTASGAAGRNDVSGQ
jgi:L,D-transpeptidase ErfK/SrfK